MQPVIDRELTPRWLGEVDSPWLGEVLAGYHRMEGHPVRELEELFATPLACAPPARGLRTARVVLDRLWLDRVGSELSPAAVREAVFRHGASAPERTRAIELAARELETSPDEIERALFADLPREKLLVPPSVGLTTSELATRCNLQTAERILSKASSVRLEVDGEAADVVRAAKKRGLICVVHPTNEGARMEISGPLSLFRATRMYGRALASLVPALASARAFKLRALLITHHGPQCWVITSRDPIFPPGMPAPTFDSAIERAFAKRFVRVAPDWDLVREPEPVRAEDTLIFPDFALVHRRDPRQRWLLEIVGFWTREYLENKLTRLRDAGLDRLVLCVSDKLACSDTALPEGARVVKFAQRIDPREVLRVIGASESRQLGSTSVDDWP